MSWRLGLAPNALPPGEPHRATDLESALHRRVRRSVHCLARGAVPEHLDLDLDATDDPIHGRQEERFFHGYYDNYCYLPLYVFLR